MELTTLRRPPSQLGGIFRATGLQKPHFPITLATGLDSDYLSNRDIPLGLEYAYNAYNAYWKEITCI